MKGTWMRALNGLSVAGLLLGALTSVRAVGPDTTPITVAYTGRLERDGLPAQGTYDFRVQLFDRATGGTASWTETHTGVTVAAGQFSLALGTVTPLTETLLAVATPHVGLEVRPSQPPNGTFVAFTARQALRAAPVAVRARATLGLTVDNKRALESATQANSLVLNPGMDFGHIILNNGRNPLAITNNWQGFPDGNSSAAEISNDTGTYRALMIVGNQSGGGGRRRVAVYDDVNIPNGTLSVAGRLSANGGLTVPGILKNSASAAETTYNVDVSRYVVVAPYRTGIGQNLTIANTPVDQSRLEAMCADIDGCTVRLMMRNWDDGTNAADAAIGPLHFSYRTDSRRWRITTTTYTGPDVAAGGTVDQGYVYGEGRDQDSVNGHVARTWNCYFTDATWPVGTSAPDDSAAGMTLLNWNAYPTYTADCVLIIDD